LIISFAEKRKTIAATFEGMARELFAKNKSKWSKAYAKSMQSRLERHVFPWLGSMRLVDIEPPDVLAVIQRAESHGKIEMAHRLKMLPDYP